MAKTELDKIKEALVNLGYDDTVVFENESYEGAFIGVDDESGRAIYDYDLMIDCLVNDGWECDDAIEWIEYNTVRALPYAGDKAPIILRRFDYHEYCDE